MDQELANTEPAATADLPPPGRRPVSKLRRRLLVATVVLVNLTFLVVFFSPVWTYYLIPILRPLVGEFTRPLLEGFPLGQGALVALWAALGGGRSLWRSLAVALGVIAAAWLMNHTHPEPHKYFPIRLLGPVWGFLLVARLLGLGLVSAPNAPRKLQPLQYTIADMLRWTTAVAVVSGLLRWLALDWRWLSMNWDAWTDFSLLALVAMAAMFLALGRGRPLLRILLLPLLSAACMGSVDVLSVIMAQPLSARELGACAVSIASIAGWLVGSLWLIRLAGYRLAWQWRFKRSGKEFGSRKSEFGG